jgi:uncharacterized protein YlbG (UPF0298 family)
MEKLIELLNERKKIIAKEEENGTELSNYEKNERKITLLKTDIELAQTHTNKIKKNKYIEDVRNSFSDILKEMDKEWSNLIEKAENVRDKKQEVNTILETFDMVKFEENWELAVNFYVNLKNAVNPPKEEKKLSKV